jgi:hypothetical protein
LSANENVKVHVSKKERLPGGNEVEFGVEATVPTGDVLATFRHWRLMFQELVATPGATVPATPATTVEYSAVGASKPVQPPTLKPETAAGSGTRPATPAPPTRPVTNADPYADLPWTPSKDDPSFSWIHLDEKLSPIHVAEKFVPRICQLIEEIGRTPNHCVRYGRVTYDLSSPQLDGTSFLHRKDEAAERKKQS